MVDSIHFHHSPALLAFRRVAGDANRLCNTLLAGLETMRKNVPLRPKDLVVSWHPPTTESEWNDARNFALMMTMVATIDGLDQFLRIVSRIPDFVPTALHDVVNGRRNAAMQRRPTLSERVEALCANFPGVVEPDHILSVDLLATWRHRFVHRDYRFSLRSNTRKGLEAAVDFFRLEHGGSDIREALRRFDAGEAPTMGSLATLLASAHRLTSALDAHLLVRQQGPAYAISLLSYLISSRVNPREFIEGLWRGGGSIVIGRICAMYCENGAYDGPDPVSHAPSTSRAELEQVIPLGRNRALELFGSNV